MPRYASLVPVVAGFARPCLHLWPKSGASPHHVEVRRVIHTVPRRFLRHYSPLSRSVIRLAALSTSWCGEQSDDWQLVVRLKTDLFLSASQIDVAKSPSRK
jgi:hypothetical protein